MRQILLNGVYYQIHSDIKTRRINPWKAKLGGASLEYSDFGQAELEEYFDFRNGIGKKRGVGSDARLDWSEGIDFTSEGQAVLGPLVNTADYATWVANTAYSLLNFRIPTTANTYCYECTTAGTSHAATEPTWPTTVGNTVADGSVTWTCRAYLAPVKIIDFESNTYVIQNSRILKWDGTNLDCVDKSLASPIDAIVITDDTDSYLVVSSATGAIYTTDGTTWTRIFEDFTGYTEVDGTGRLSVIATRATGVDVDADVDVYLYKDKGVSYFDDINIMFQVYVENLSHGSGMGGMAVANTVGDLTDFATTDIAVMFQGNGTIRLYRGNNAAGDSYAGAVETAYYCTLSRAAGSDTVNLYIYSDANRSTLLDTLTVSGFSTTKYRYVYGFLNKNSSTAGYDWDGYVTEMSLNEHMGYLADFENRLYSIKTDGSRVIYSASKNIDAYSGRFTLTGNYGTVYRLFEGKLLSDGTPTLYFSGTQGLFSLDITNEIAYKQEVSYPPITNAGNVGIYWNANVWVATGYGILKMAPSVATFVGPDQDDGLPSGSQGKVYDFATVNNWLVFCVNGGSTDESSIFKRNSTLGGNLQVYTTSAANKAIACLHHSPSSLYTNGRLWFGEGTDVKYMMFPDTTHNVKQIATYEYVNDSGYGNLPIFRKLAAIPKTALGVAAITKSCSATDYIEVFYGLNGAAATTSLGTFITSPKPTALTFGSGLGTAFYTIQFAIKLFQGATATNSPELESLMFYWLPVPTTILGWQFRIQCTDENAAETIADLEAIRDTQTLVAFYPSGDEKKTSYNVKLTQLGEQLMYEQQGAKEGWLDVVLEEIFRG